MATTFSRAQGAPLSGVLLIASGVVAPLLMVFHPYARGADVAARLVSLTEISPLSRHVHLAMIVCIVASLHPAIGVQLLVLSLPGQPDPFSTVIYTLEARRRTGSYESRLAGDAVIIHRVKDYGIAYSMDADVPPADHSSNDGSMLKSGERWNMPEGQHWVEVLEATANGFVVRVGPRTRIMSSPLSPLLSGLDNVGNSRAGVSALRARPTQRQMMGILGVTYAR